MNVNSHTRKYHRQIIICPLHDTTIKRFLFGPFSLVPGSVDLLLESGCRLVSAWFGVLGGAAPDWDLLGVCGDSPGGAFLGAVWLGSLRI